jgi:hypothetical protein
VPTQKIEIQKGEDLREKCADTEKRKRKRGEKTSEKQCADTENREKKEEAPKQAQKRNFIQELQDSDQLRGVVDVGHWVNWS